jgi:hypothetical protein
MPAMIAGSESRSGEAGGFMPTDVHHCHPVLDRGSLQATALMVFLGAREAGQDQRLLAVDEVPAIELRAHLHGQLAALQGLEGMDGVRCGEREVAAEGDEHLDVAAVHRLDGAHDVETVLARRVDRADLFRTRPRRRGRTAC